MTIAIEIGATFGSLTVVRLIRGRKNVHPLALCRCSCGAARTPTQSALRRGKALACKSCALKHAWSSRARVPEGERYLLAKETEYRSNAKSKGIRFELPRAAFRKLIDGECRYCGVLPARGIDRVDSNGSYQASNTVSCCAECNYAKRTLTNDQFLALVARIYRHSISGAP